MTGNPGAPRRPRQREGSDYDRPHSLRADDDLWQQIQEVATRDRLTASFVLAALARDFGAGKLQPPEATKSGGRSRSARIDNETWEKFAQASARLGLRPTGVLMGLAAEYAAGLIRVDVNVSTRQVPIQTVSPEDQLARSARRLVRAVLGDPTLTIPTSDAEVTGAVRAAMIALPERESEVLTWRFGLNGSCEKSPEEISQIHGRSIQRIRAFESKAMSMLRHPDRVGIFVDLLSPRAD